MTNLMEQQESISDMSHTFNSTLLLELHTMCSRAGTMMIVRTRRVENGF